MTDSRQKIYLLATIVGIIAGFFGAGFHFALDQALVWRKELTEMLQHWYIPGWLITMVFGAGMVCLARYLVRRFAPETAGSGIQEIEGVLEGVRSLEWQRVLPVKFVSGWLAIASGLVLGREGPTVHMGSAVGKMISDWAGLSRHGTQTLIAAGAGAGLAAAFNAPIAGIIFITEEMRRQFEYNYVSLHSVMLACCMAVVINDVWLAQGPVLPISVYLLYPQPILLDLILFSAMGILIGGVGVLFNKAILCGLNAMSGLHQYQEDATAALFGAVMGILVWFIPDVTGGGDKLIETLLGEHLVLGVLVALLIARTVTSVLSYGAGTPGGIFAPMLALGTLAGLSFGLALHYLLPGVTTHAVVFAVAAMGALFSATVRAPVTGIILVAEVTGSYDMLLASAITCITASITAHALGGQPIYSLLLQRTIKSQGTGTSVS
jgi:H+/Cl- antiporter ClcA